MVNLAGRVIYRGTNWANETVQLASTPVVTLAAPQFFV